MTTQVLGIDLRDAGRDGVYRVAPDDPATLVDDAARAGLHVMRVNLQGCTTDAELHARLAQAIASPGDLGDWSALGAALRDLAWLGAPGYVLLFDHAGALRRADRAAFAALHALLCDVAREWHARGVPFFVFLEFPDNETRDAAIDA